MLFYSSEFLIFLFIVISTYYTLNRFRFIKIAKYFLVVSSLGFYSSFNIFNLPILLSSIIVNFFLSTLIIRKKKKILLVLGIIFNLLLLCYYKYFDFLIININYFLGTDFDVLGTSLPLAISFFTLQQIAYIVDSYEELIKEQKFVDYTLFVTFFPQLIIGPIVHHVEMMPQFRKLKTKIFNLDNVVLGVVLFTIGFLKKVFIADSIAPDVNYLFDETVVLTLIESWTASIGYTLQLYFDFSGYTDMALGIALIFNIKLPTNFNSPLKSTSIIDFWLRWHITLTNFLTTYIYTPILYSFKKLTFLKSLVAVFITFLICGIWHGAGWTYIVFGLAHSIVLIINHVWRRHKLPMYKYLGWLMTFMFVNTTFTIFRAQDMEMASKVIYGMFTFGNIGSFESIKLLVYILIGLCLAIFFKNSNEIVIFVKKLLKNH